MSLIVHINGYPGVGKLTVGRALAEAIGGRLVDNHSIYNLAFALTEPKSAAYFETLRAVRAIAFRRVLELPPEVPVVMTNAHMIDSDWGNENWDAVIALARSRGAKLAVVVLDVDAEENDRRIAAPERAAKRKLQDPAKFTANRAGRPLIDRGGDFTLRFDTTALTAQETTAKVIAWVRTLPA
jgi:predicted kinase